MNTDQLNSLIRTVLKIVSSLLIAHGLSDTATVLNSPDAIGAVMLIVSLLWSHFAHASNSPTSANGSKLPALFVLGALGATLVLSGTGCSSTPQAAAYKAVGATDVTVQAALAAYDQFAAAGKTTPAQNAAVKAAFQKYQAAFAVVCDAGAIYSASSGTNAPAASLALQQAVVNANQSIADLIALVQSFGVKL